MVIKRCVDVTDLLGAATTGQADVALVALDAPGLDQAAVDHLERHYVRLLGVEAAGAGEGSRARAARVGVTEVLAEADVAHLSLRLAAPAPGDDTAADKAPATEQSRDLGIASDGVVSADREPGRVVAVWGPAGAPGRTTLAVALAGALAARSASVTLIDADPYGGAVAQQLGIVEEVSGILAASRFAAAGELAGRLPQAMRETQAIRVVSGLPRPDRWTEVRPGTVQHLVELAARDSHVVIDTGFSLEDSGPGDYGTRPPRNSMTIGALEAADCVVVVGAGDPVGLARLARAVVDLEELLPRAAVRIVVNRMRGSLGWSVKQIAELVAGFTDAPLNAVPEDRAGADRALLNGVPLLTGPAGVAMTGLAGELWPLPAPTRVRLGRLRKRTADKGRRR